ncbi:hypothetical protein GN244_ATG14201 [Phytophthora infestans]|uniref:Uncharacterized protein n=1 Tax=Phytophthora infestans TaxID=4787 RepID=A0A833W9E8_PHYIN|nr:hypothetical protein GN244_ATG14201 [Phytophthora infestans]
MDEMFEAMNILAMEKDHARAVRYVATVRPAMAAVRDTCLVDHLEYGGMCRSEEGACVERSADEVCSTHG